MSDIKVNIKVEDNATVILESLVEACERIRREAEMLNPARNLPMFINENDTVDVDYIDVTNDQKLLS